MKPRKLSVTIKSVTPEHGTPNTSGLAEQQLITEHRTLAEQQNTKAQRNSSGTAKQ